MNNSPVVYRTTPYYWDRLRCKRTCSKDTAYACSSFLTPSESREASDAVLRMEHRLLWELEGVSWRRGSDDDDGWVGRRSARKDE